MKDIFLKWSAIERLGNSKIAKSSYYWFFIVPIFAKLFQKVPKKIYLDSINNNPIELNLSFPFSWYLIFSAGFLFVISNLIYRWACPHIVREFKNFSEFKASGYPNSYLYAQGAFHNIPEEKGFELEMKNPGAEGLKFDHKKTEYEKEHIFVNLQKEYFDLVYNTANKTKLLIRILATLIILVALVLIGYIVFQNVQTVFEIYQDKTNI